MPKIERTKEERERFRMGLHDVLEKLVEVQEHPFKKGDGNEAKKDNADAISKLMDYLRYCDDVIVGVCGELAKKTLDREPVNLGSWEDPKLQWVTIEHIDTLRRAVAAIKQEREAAVKAAGKALGETPEVITIWQAMSRLNKVKLFDIVFNAGKYVYKARVPGKNDIPDERYVVQWFGGIPENKIPVRYVTVKSGNATITRVQPDRSISAENCERIYKILKALEKEQPTVEIPAEREDHPSSKKIVVNRDGEAECFLSQLPPGLKPWAKVKS